MFFFNYKVRGSGKEVAAVRIHLLYASNIQIIRKVIVLFLNTHWAR